MSTSIPLPNYREYPTEEMAQRCRNLLDDARRRRSVRDFSSRPVPADVIENCIRVAATAPSGANLQPWHFVVVGDTTLKRTIRIAAETEERAFYDHRAPQEWIDALEPIGTDAHKPFLEEAPWLIAVFAQSSSTDSAGEKRTHYYVKESVGIATGFLIHALDHAGLVSLTHTPSPMHFLNEILGRPSNEKPFLLLVTGYPAREARVPALEKKRFAEVATILR